MIFPCVSVRVLVTLPVSGAEATRETSSSAYEDSGINSACVGRGVEAGSVGRKGEGDRYKLRIQMNIERKRACLFENIQTLPYA